MYWVTRYVLSHTSLPFFLQLIQSKGSKPEDKIDLKILFVCLFSKGTSCVHSLSCFVPCVCIRTLMISYHHSIHHDKFKHLKILIFGGNPLHKVPGLTRSQMLIFSQLECQVFCTAKAPSKFSRTLRASKFQKITHWRVYFIKRVPEVSWN